MDSASGGDLWLWAGLWLPVFATVLWFMTRLFSGRFPDEPDPFAEMVRPPDPALDRALDRHGETVAGAPLEAVGEHVDAGPRGRDA